MKSSNKFYQTYKKYLKFVMSIKLVIFKVIINIFIITIFSFGFSGFSGSLFSIINLFFGGFFATSGSFNNSFSFGNSSINIVIDQKVIEDGTGFNLPQVQTNSSPRVIAVQVSIFFVFWVGNHWVYPWSFVVWVRDFLSIPFTVHFFVPIFWFFSIWIGNVFWFIIPACWFGVFWIVDFFVVNPVFWFFGFWIFNFFCSEHVPVFF